ncbi:hypothetical protein Ppa06_57980 [Planomonospora parontospora subsp. parontospora]|uniref:Uncharacterized protein n=2 Tax=Planomonospora parontospora TaxID=58119 RepID=A0AA37BLQ7_9ACTN|nr:hypothetical protein GCM10010126_57330 [Planomonospora parontospora]GII12000.1 hypothetical protein Ppa06_57980 [Planomonospora parontospora subsp. parontospora]
MLYGWNCGLGEVVGVDDLMEKIAGASACEVSPDVEIAVRCWIEAEEPLKRNVDFVNVFESKVDVMVNISHEATSETANMTDSSA